MTIPQVPAVTGLLRTLTCPGMPVPDAGTLRDAAIAALEVGLVRCDDPGCAVEAFVGLCCTLAPESVDSHAGSWIRVDFLDPRTLRGLAREALSDPGLDGYSESVFAASVGPMPPEAAALVDLARKETGLERILVAAAADHLVASALDVISCIPGVRKIASGALVWSGPLSNGPDLASRPAWIDMGGPGALVSVVAVGTGEDVLPHDGHPIPFPGTDESTVTSVVVLVPPSALAVSGAETWGACRVDDGVPGEVILLPDLEDGLAQFADGCPVVPTIDGFPQALIEPGVFREALARVMTVAASMAYEIVDGLPAGFERVRQPSHWGVALTVDQFGLEVRVDARTAATVAWAVGDRVVLGEDGRGRLAISRSIDGTGPSMMDDGDGGLRSEYGLPLPLSMASGPFGHSVSPPHLTERSSIIVRVSALRRVNGHTSSGPVRADDVDSLVDDVRADCRTPLQAFRYPGFLSGQVGRLLSGRRPSP